jgi:hypothetical protein
MDARFTKSDFTPTKSAAASELPSHAGERSIQLPDIKLGLRASPFATVTVFVVSGALAGFLAALVAPIATTIVEWFQYDLDWDWDVLLEALHHPSRRIDHDPIAMFGGAVGGAMGGLLTAVVASYWKWTETPAGAALLWVVLCTAVPVAINLLFPSTGNFFDPKTLAVFAAELVGVAFYGVSLGIFVSVWNRVLRRRSRESQV